MLEWSYIGEGAFWCSLNFPPNALDDSPMYTLHPVTFVSIYDSTLFKDGTFVLLSQKEALDGHTSFKVHLYPMFTACFLDTLTKAFGIQNHHVRILAVFGIVSKIFNASSVSFPGWSLGLDLHSIESPCRVLTFCKSFV